MKEGMMIQAAAGSLGKTGRNPSLQTGKSTGSGFLEMLDRRMKQKDAGTGKPQNQADVWRDQAGARRDQAGARQDKPEIPDDGCTQESSAGSPAQGKETSKDSVEDGKKTAAFQQDQAGSQDAGGAGRSENGKTFQMLGNLLAAALQNHQAVDMQPLKDITGQQQTVMQITSQQQRGMELCDAASAGSAETDRAAWFQTAVQSADTDALRAAGGAGGRDTLEQDGLHGQQTVQAETRAEDNLGIVTAGISRTKSSETGTWMAEAENSRIYAQFRSQDGQARTGGEESSEDANQALEELKRNADAKGMDFMYRISQNRMEGAIKMAGGSDAQQVHTPVMEQLKSGLAQGLKGNKDEFFIHLKPDGLGDIVVHLTNSGDKVSVRIGISSPETEKLVTSQMESLRDMLRPLNAQVDSVYHNSQGAMDFTGYGQQMQEHRGRQTGSSHRPAERGTDLEDNFLPEAGRMIAESRLSRLYAYV